MMNKPRLTLLGSQQDTLVRFLESHPQGHERAAVILFRRLHVVVDGLEDSDRYLAIDIIPFEEDWITDSSSNHVSFDLAPLREIFRRCEEESLVFGFVHNHPQGLSDFSEIDDHNELTLLSALRNRNGLNISFVSMLWTNGAWNARIRSAISPEVIIPVKHTLVIADDLRLFGYEECAGENAEVLKRQAAAFGRPFVDILQSLRIGVVGAGGTGSAVVTLLARAGFGELVIIDGDSLEKSNLNRVRGSSAQDVGREKAKILKKFVENLGLPVKVSAITTFIDESPFAVDALASCDVVFGCTDDHVGREVLNTALYVYAQAYIDLGLGGKVVDDAFGNSLLRNHHARLSTILPEHGECLFCQDVIRDVWIQHQLALRENPGMTEEEAKDKYLQGGGEEAPGVGPFTGAAADFAVANLFNLVRPFRRLPPNLRKDLYSIDFVNMEFSSRQEKSDKDCPYCQNKNYLLTKESYRLNRPILGKRDEHN